MNYRINLMNITLPVEMYTFLVPEYASMPIGTRCNHGGHPGTIVGEGGQVKLDQPAFVQWTYMYYEHLEQKRRSIMTVLEKNIRGVPKLIAGGSEVEGYDKHTRVHVHARALQQDEATRFSGLPNPFIKAETELVAKFTVEVTASAQHLSVGERVNIPPGENSGTEELTGIITGRGKMQQWLVRAAAGRRNAGGPRTPTATARVPAVVAHPTIPQAGTTPGRSTGGSLARGTQKSIRAVAHSRGAMEHSSQRFQSLCNPSHLNLSLSLLSRGLADY